MVCVLQECIRKRRMAQVVAQSSNAQGELVQWGENVGEVDGGLPCADNVMDAL